MIVVGALFQQLFANLLERGQLIRCDHDGLRQVEHVEPGTSTKISLSVGRRQPLVYHEGRCVHADQGDAPLRQLQKDRRRRFVQVSAGPRVRDAGLV